jgi:hypothetical protein
VVDTYEKKIWLFGVFRSCPLKMPLHTCPFNKLRKEALINRWNHVETLSVNEIGELICYHKKCLLGRVTWQIIYKDKVLLN